MPYYCTVPLCTSMAGKAKNVSFHQFPRDEELAKLWNEILKRGKPYTKYSKVCSKHFKPEDYTITSVGKNKGLWRTLRKDAIPSQNLPSDSPLLKRHRHRNTGSWVRDDPASSLLDTQMQQQMARAIYMQTMLALQTTGFNADGNSSTDELQNHEAHASNETQNQENGTPLSNGFKTPHKCTECSKYFKDPDVFLLHQRTHTKNNEKENLNTNSEEEKFNPMLESLNPTAEETLKSNPILANLLKTQGNVDLDVQNHVISIENQVLTAVKSTMDNFFRNLLLPQGANGLTEDRVKIESDCDNELNECVDSSREAVDDNV